MLFIFRKLLLEHKALLYETKTKNIFSLLKFKMSPVTFLGFKPKKLRISGVDVLKNVTVSWKKNYFLLICFLILI